LKDVVRSIFEKSRAFNSIYVQMLIIIVVFAVMGVTGVSLVSRMERRHFDNDIQYLIAIAEAGLEADFSDCEILLNNFSFNIQNMLLDGADEDLILSYMKDRTNVPLYISDTVPWLTAVHGYFFNWGGVYLTSNDRNQSLDSARQEEPLYEAAVSARGEMIVSRPSVDIFFGNYSITFSKVITSEDGEPLAVISVDIDSGMFMKYAGLDITANSYGILLNDKLDVIAHQNQDFVGMKLYNLNSDISRFSFTLSSGENVYNQRTKAVLASVVCITQMKYGWFYGFSIPAHEYFSRLNLIIIVMILLELLFAPGLCAMIYYISQAKIKSDKRTQQKSNFLATMSHEVRTPLNAILGMTEIQMQNTAHPLPTIEAFVKINNSGKLLLNIINDILDLSKIESGKLELIPVNYDVASLINDIIQLNYIRYEDKPVNFTIEIDENIPATLVGDELRIKQILNNLLSNAFKYTDSGEVKFSVNSHVIGRGGGAVVVTLIFKVEDTGQGMTPDQLNRLFDEYTRFNLEANRTTEGAGLGMTITRNLINLMYGQIDVSSTFGEGTSVIVRLPQKTDGMGIRGVLGKQTAENLRQFKKDNTIQLKKTRIPHEYMPYGRIMIVDDVETNLYVAQGLMSPYGLKIDLATNGFEAIEKIKEGNIYDIVFMDHMMPKMDGMEATKALRGMGYTRPVVALTANALAGQADLFLNNGFDDFISKPIDVRLLNGILNKLIRDKQPMEILEAARKEKEKMGIVSGAGGSERHNIAPQLAEIFARDAKKAASVLTSCLLNNFNSEDYIHMYIINVHAMKSALANIGEKELSSAALKLEKAGRDKDLNVMLSETSDFILNLKAIINRISVNTKDEDIEDTEEALGFLSGKLDIIREACASMDKKTAKTALNELKEKAWSHNIKTLLDSISEHLLHSEFDEALEDIEKRNAR